MIRKERVSLRRGLSLWRQARIRAKVSWRNFKRSPGYSAIAEKKGVALQGLAVVALLVIAGLWLDAGISDAYDKLIAWWHSLVWPTISTSNLWIALGVIAAIIVAYYLLRNEKDREVATSLWQSTLLRGALVAAAIWFIAIPMYKEWREPKVVVTREWSEPIKIRVGQMLLWDPRTNVRFEVNILPSGNIYTFEPLEAGDKISACERFGWIAEKSKAIQLRILEKEIEKATFDLHFEKFQNGGPCDQGQFQAPEPQTPPSPSPKEGEEEVAPPPPPVPPAPPSQRAAN